MRPMTDDGPELRTCIYCLERRPCSEFNTEHVVQEAFGCFTTQNLTLQCVCESCNHHFSKTIDLNLGRDSLEGFYRFVLGYKPVSEYKSLGRRARSRLRINEPGPWYGAFAQPRANAVGVFDIALASQIGFALSETENATWYLWHEVPKWQQVRERLGLSGGTEVMINVRLSDPPAKQDLDRILREKGFPSIVLDEAARLPVVDGRVRVGTLPAAATT